MKGRAAMVDFDRQLGSIRITMGTHLWGMSVRISRKVNGGVKTHPRREWCHVVGWGPRLSDKEKG